MEAGRWSTARDARSCAGAAHAGARMALRRARRAAAGTDRGRRGPHGRRISGQPHQHGGARCRRARCWPRTSVSGPRSRSTRAAIRRAPRGAGSRRARTTALLSVVFNGDESQLTNVDAVTDGYPLRGSVLVADEPFATGTPARGIPAARRGLAGLEAARRPRRRSRLAVVDRRGELSRRTRADLAARSGRHLRGPGAESADECQATCPATQLIQPGSRVSYARSVRRRAAARIDDLQDLAPWRTSSARERLRDITDASPQIENAVDRAGRFLSLASLVSVLLCAIAVAMSARHYVDRHLDAVALLKTLGATRAFTLGCHAAAAGRGCAACRGRRVRARLPRPGMAAAHDPRPAGPPSLPPAELVARRQSAS